jgi:hypothetical protein
LKKSTPHLPCKSVQFPRDPCSCFVVVVATAAE